MTGVAEASRAEATRASRPRRRRRRAIASGGDEPREDRIWAGMRHREWKVSGTALAESASHPRLPGGTLHLHGTAGTQPPLARPGRVSATLVGWCVRPDSVRGVPERDASSRDRRESTRRRRAPQGTEDEPGGGTGRNGREIEFYSPPTFGSHGVHYVGSRLSTSATGRNVFGIRRRRGMGDSGGTERRHVLCRPCGGSRLRSLEVGGVSLVRARRRRPL